MKDEDREQELLLHVAAGTDPLTALAALPRDENPPDKRPRRKPAGCLGAIVIAGVLLLLLRWL